MDLCMCIYVDFGSDRYHSRMAAPIHLCTSRAWAALCHHKYLALTSFLIFAKWINMLRELLFWLAFLWLQINLSISSYAWWLLRFFSGKLLIYNNPWAFFSTEVLVFFLLIYRILKYILDTNPLLFSDIAGLFESVIYLFILPMLSFVWTWPFFLCFVQSLTNTLLSSVTMLITLVPLRFRCAGIAELS